MGKVDRSAITWSACALVCLVAQIAVAGDPGPRLRWQQVRDLDGRSDVVVETAISGGRVAVLGTGEIHIPGPPREFDPILRVHRMATGRLVWERVFSDAGFDRATDLAVQGSRRIFVSGGDGFAVRAFASATGRELWVRDGAEGKVRALATVGALVYAVGDDDRRTRIRALRARTGRVAWERMIEPVEPGHRETGRAIEVVADRVFVLYHRSSPDLLFGQWVLAAHAADSGERLWRHELPVSEPRQVLLAAGENRAFLAFFRDRSPRSFPGGEALEVRAVDAATGELDWRFERDLDRDDLRHGFRPRALVAAGPRLILSGGQDPIRPDQTSFFVLALRAGTGEALWQDGLRDPNRNRGDAPDLAVREREVVVVATLGGNDPDTGEFRMETLLRSYRIGTGRIQWTRRETGGAFSGFEGQRVALSNRRLIAAGCEQRVPPDECDIGVRGYTLPH